MYTDNIKQFAKNEKELKTDSNNMNNKNEQKYEYKNEFTFDKYAMLITKSGKRQITKVMGLSNQEWILTLGE